jgi:hypothetical protein
MNEPFSQAQSHSPVRTTLGQLTGRFVPEPAGGREAAYNLVSH